MNNVIWVLRSMLLAVFFIFFFCCNDKTDKKSNLNSTSNVSDLASQESTSFTSPILKGYEAKYDSLKKNEDFDTTKSESIAEKLNKQFEPKFGVDSQLTPDTVIQEIAQFGTSNPPLNDVKNDRVIISSVANAQEALSSVVDNSIDYAYIRDGVDWLFDRAGNGSPTRIEVWGYMVPFFGYSFPRGYLGARSCGNYAVMHAVCGMKNEALVWLQAAQAHNPEAVAMFGKHGDYTVNYAVSKYGVRACEEMGIPYYAAAGAILGVLKANLEGYNPPPFPNPPSNDMGRFPHRNN